MTFVPAEVVCSCGGEATVEVTISGKAKEFGPQGDQTYQLRLMDSDITSDDCLVNVYGKYPTFVAADDSVAFRIVFRLKCSADCKKVAGVGVDKLELSIKGGAWQQQGEATGAGDTLGLLDPTSPGKYDVETSGTAAGPDTDDGGELEFTMEFYLSKSNVGGGKFKCDCYGTGITNAKEDVRAALGIAGAACTVAAMFGWAFGAGLQVHVLLHILADEVANDKSPWNYQSDPNYQSCVIPSDLTLTRSQTDSPDFSESLNQMGNEAINKDLAVTSLCQALATATNRYYTSQAEGDVASMEMQLGAIQTFLSDLRRTEVEATDMMMAFAIALASESPDPTITQQQFAYFQDNVSTSGLPPEEIDLLNSLIAKGDPILFEGFDYVDYLESLVTSVSFPLLEQPVSNATKEIAETMQYTSHVIGPFPTSVGGIVLPVDKFGLLAPYIGLASTIIVATAATAIYVKRVKRRKEKQ